MSIVYSSKIQNRVMLSGEGNENWQKKSVGLISKKTEQLCTCNTLSHAFLCRCFARPQRDFSRNFLVTRFMEEILYVFQFTFSSLPLIYTLVASNFSHFLSAAIKFSWYSCNEIGLLLFFFISRPTSFFVIHVKVDIKIKPRERKNRLCCQVVFISKSPGGYEIYLGNGRVLEMQNFTPAYMKEWTYARADFLRTKTDLTS